MRKLTSFFVVALVLVPLTAVMGVGQAGAAPPDPATEPLVLVHDLNYPFVDGQSTAGAVNASGQVAGESIDAVEEGFFGYISDPSNADATLLEPLIPIADVPESSADAINDAGVAAGSSPAPVGCCSSSGPDVAVVWGSANSPTSLGTIGNRTCTFDNPQIIVCDASNATGINNTGTAVGVSDRDDGSGGRIHHAFADALATLTMTDLGTLAGGSNSAATGVNDAGIVVGNSETTNGGGGLTTHAFVDDLATHTMTDLGTLAGGTSSGATAINANGLVVGNSTVTGGANHPFTYDLTSHTMTDLGLPPGATSAGATAVNDGGLVVGNSDAGPWVYDPTTMSFALIAGADTATGINDSDEIVGVGQLPDPGDASNIVTGPYRTFVDLAAPNPPTNLGIATACGSPPVLRWTASAPKFHAPADGYVVFRNGVMIDKVTGTAYVDNSAIAPATYSVAAVDPVGLSTMSNAVIWTCRPGITGTVTAGGSAIGGIDVRVYDAGTDTLAAKAQTDPAGRYGVPGLAAGSYNVRFSDSTGRFVLGWNGGAATQATAPAVVVGAGATVTVDAALLVAGHITGTVTDLLPGGFSEPVSAVVRVYRLGGPEVAKVTGGDGTYDVGGLAPGSYQLQFSDPSDRTVTVWNGGGTSRTTAPAVTVTAGATTEVDVSTVVAAFVLGTVSGAGAPLADIDVRLYVAGTDTLQAKTTTASDGTYRFDVGPGTYQIRFSDPTNQFARQWATGATKQSHTTSFTLVASAGPTVDITMVEQSP